MNTESFYTIQRKSFECYDKALNAWSSRHALGLGSQQSQQRRLECYTNKAPDMHWESWTISRIPARPKEAWSVTSRTPGSHAAWDRSSLTVEPAKKSRVSSHEN